ncbi:chromatin modification-related protein eaf-1-like [Eutrema salsugineum]|uniref:chromatin modification-related protein eaf-1-like n=1 Tax=Eutrema salsugineum TaxID=72664 RepID=UPI000CED6E34|nr:chromatin modification-related protein eaf-1-like [Eutrema salsugineum]
MADQERIEQQAQEAEHQAHPNQAQAERNEQQAYVDQNMAQRNERQAQLNQYQANRNEQQAKNIPQPQPQPQRQPPLVFVGENDRANAHQYKARIQAPPVQNNNFEVKASLLDMVQNSKFHGLPMEDPLEHLDQFDRVYDLTKINGVSEDSFKLRLFPFSLGDKAHQWEMNLPRGTIETWEKCKLAFLSKLFSTSRAAKLRNQISSFTQHTNESFGEAWERNQLDTTSNGNFLGKEINAATELVENLAMSNDTYGEDFDRANRKEGSTKELRIEKDIRELQNKLDKHKQQFSGQQQIYGQQQQSAQGSNYNSQPQQHKFPPGFSPQLMGHQQQQQAPVQNQMGPDMCGLLQQFLQGQQRVESQYASMKQDISELMQNQASTSSRGQALPGKPEPNPKEHVNAITLRSGKELQGPDPKQKLIEDNEQIGGEAASRDEQEDVVSKEEPVKDKAKEVEKAPELEKPYVPPPPYQPKIPFPGRFKKQILDRAKAVFEKHLENTQMTLPILDAFLAIPQLGKFLKDAILNKTKEL